MSVAILLPLYLQEGITEVYRRARVYARVLVNGEKCSKHSRQQRCADDSNLSVSWGWTQSEEQEPSRREPEQARQINATEPIVGQHQLSRTGRTLDAVGELDLGSSEVLHKSKNSVTIMLLLLTFTHQRQTATQG